MTKLKLKCQQVIRKYMEFTDEDLARLEKKVHVINKKLDRKIEPEMNFENQYKKVWL